MAGILATIKGLSPLGPIFSKELRVTARRKRTYVLRFLYVLALLLILLMIWAVTHDDMRNDSVARKAQVTAEMGAYFFCAFAIFSAASMAVIGPILTATAVNSERLHKTLPVLLMTPITAWQIVAGKLFSRLLIALTLLGLSLPVLALVRLLGGVEIEQIVGALLTCVAIVVFMASLGLFFSTLMNRAYAVIILSYGMVGFLWLVIPLLATWTIFETRGPRAVTLVINLWGYTNPGFSIGTLSIPDDVPPFRGYWPWPVVIHLIASALLLAWCAAILRRRARKESESAGSAPATSPAPTGSAGGWDAAPELAFARPGLIRRWFGQELGKNPVLWREIRRPLLAKRWQKVASCLVAIGLLLFIYIILAAENGLDDEEPQMAFACIFCGILNLLACVISATAIAQEKESDTWTLLMATPLAPRRIIWGKMLGLMRRLLWPCVLVVAHFSIFALCGVIEPGPFLIVLWLMFTTNLVWLACGLYFSLRLRTVTFAVIANLLVPVVIYGLVALLLTIAGALIDNDDDWGEVVGAYMPYPYMVELIDEPGRYYRQGNVWLPAFGQTSVREAYILAFTLGCLYLAATAAILVYTAWRFNPIVGRAEQIAKLESMPPLLELHPA